MIFRLGGIDHHVQNLARAARDGFFSGEAEQRQFSRDVIACRGKQAYDVMASRAGGGAVREAFTSHFLDLDVNIDRRFGRVGVFDAWGGATRNGEEAFYNISATNLVTTGARLLDRIAESHRTNSVKLDEIVAFDRILQSGLSLRRFVKPWIDCRRRSGGGPCARCSLRELERVGMKSSFDIAEGRVDFDFSGEGRRQTTVLDTTAKRDVAFNFYFLEKDDAYPVHTGLYGNMIGSAPVTIWNRLFRAGLIQTHDLITPEFHALLKHVVGGFVGGKAFLGGLGGLRDGMLLNDLYDWLHGVEKRIRSKPIQQQQQKAHNIKRHGFSTCVWKELQLIWPLELIFVGPHILPGLQLRAWNSFYRIANDKTFALNRLLRAKAIGDIFRIQALIPGTMRAQDHDWRIAREGHGAPVRLTSH